MSTSEKEALKAIYARLEAKGWPNLSENEDLCMERAKEFLDAVDALGLREPTRQRIYTGPGTPNNERRT